MIELMDTCPLCGSQVVFAYVSRVTGNAFDGYTVRCSNPLCAGHNMSTVYDTYADALTAWCAMSQAPQQNKVSDWNAVVEALREVHQ